MVMPVIGLFTGKLDFSNMFISLNREHYATLAEAQAASASVTEKECPYCKKKINIHAIRCPHCTSVLEDK